MAPWGARGGRPATVALVVVTALVLAATAASGYARWELVDRDAFSARVASSLDDRDVRAVLAAQIVDGLTPAVAVDALAVRPLLIAATTALADTAPFRRVLTASARRRHDRLFAGGQGVALDLAAGDGVLLSALRSVSPRVANAIPRGLQVAVVALRPRSFEVAGARWLDRLAGWWWPLLAASALLTAACALLAGSVREGLVALGIAVAGAGLLVAAAVAGLGAFVVSHAAPAANLSTDTEHAALAAVWSALLGDLRSAGLLAALGGVAVAALASGGLATHRVRALGRRLARAPSPAARRARAVVIVAVGLALFLAPALVVRAAAGVAGVVLVLVGAAELTGGSPERPGGGAPAGRTALVLAAAVGGVLVATGAAIALVLPAPGAAPAPVRAAGACNGAVALCARRLDEVVFPATHNSYAASDRRGWFFANQRRDIARQLRDGIRGLLLDVHFGVRDARSGRIRTNLAYEGSSRNKVVRELGPGAVRTAERLAGPIGVGPLDGPRGVFLCHTLCELGAEPLDAELDVLRRFVESHPRDVVVLFVEPYVPVGEIEGALRRTRLLSSAAVVRRDAPLPTLGELVDAGTPLVVLAEQDGGTRPWYLDGFSFAQDTPYSSRRADELTCARARGSADSPLLLVNHWIATFPPSRSRNAAIGGTFLERRLARCKRERRLLPNLVAVDFYERSDVVPIARRLNAERR
jgi:hypothetical protein